MHRHLAVPYALSAHACLPLPPPLSLLLITRCPLLCCVLCCVPHVARWGIQAWLTAFRKLLLTSYHIYYALVALPHLPSPSRSLSKSLKCKFHSHCSATTTAISFSFSTKLTIKAFQFQLTLDMPLKLNALQSTSMRAVKVTNNVPLMLYDDQRRRRRIPGLKCLNSLANLWPQYANWGHVGSALV